MENSYVENRDTTGIESDSDTEVIDNSFIDESFSKIKTPGKKNHTVFVPESDDTKSEDEDVSEANLSKSVKNRSRINHLVVLSSDDDKSKREKGSIEKQSSSSNNFVLSSSDDEDEASPEMKPRRRPKISSRLSQSFIGRKTKKRIFLIDSDTENSIIVEHDNNTKLKCLKDTPAKIEKRDLRRNVLDIKNMSIQSNDSLQSDDEQISDDDKEEIDNNVQDNDHISDEKNSNDGHNTTDCGSQHSDSRSDNIDTGTDCDISLKDDDLKEGDEGKIEVYSSDENKNEVNFHDKDKIEEYSSDENKNEVNFHDEDKIEEYSSDENKNALNFHDEDKIEVYSSDEGPDEDQMVMSRATRMSIMGIMPKENDSDDSDYLQSDDTNHTSRGSSLSNLTDPPNKETPQKAEDTSRLTCSPIQSPLHDITNTQNVDITASVSSPDVCNLTGSEPCDVSNRVNNKFDNTRVKYEERVIDDDVTIIDTKPEILEISSDEDEVKDDKKSPNTKSKMNGEPSAKKDNSMKQYLLPASYPNQVIYVKKEVRELELAELNKSKAELKHVNHLLQNMDMKILPDKGLKLIDRFTFLEEEIRARGNRVANMVVSPDDPTLEEAAKDGKEKKSPFNKDKETPSWDDLQKASDAVQPKMFGKQAMATHMAERNLILERLRDLYESLASRPPEDHHDTQPTALVTALMDHQLHALAWLHWRETQRPRGGILADDMGLGKTITMIALLVSDKEKNIDYDDDDDDGRGRSRLARGGTLVVCPASLMQQWSGEVAKHCRPHAVTVCHHHGASRATQPHRLASYDLVITTYNILQRESEKNGVLTRIRWRRAILDEAHVVRNYKSATSVGVCSLVASSRWTLTGTPLHNKDLDLFALLKFLRCTPFNDLAMWKKWIDNKSLGGQERLSTIMRCIMLRRTKLLLQEKGQLTCLPERSVHSCDVTLSNEEMKVYQKVLVFSKTLLSQFIQQRAGRVGDFAPGKDSDYSKMHKKMIALQGAKPVKSHEILVLLLRLRQICCHCGLIEKMLNSDDTADVVEDEGGADLLDELNKLTLEDSRSNRKSKDKEDDDDEEDPGEGTTAAEAIRSVLSRNNPVFNLGRQSSKIKAVMKCLNNNVFPNKGEKAVIVSQWTSVLRLVEEALTAMRVKSVTLSGTVPVPARAELVNAVNDTKSDVKVMLLSLCAGGVGLNLCGANHLLLLDPHWNPQLEEQAQDRIYRMGQNKHVHIYRFVCVGTVEQRIRQLQNDKLKMAENVLTGARNTNASKLSIDDLKMLFNMGPPPDS